VKQFLLKEYGDEPLDILSVTSIKNYRREKFFAERLIEDIEDKKTTIEIRYPKSMDDLFDDPSYWYQAECFLNKIFDENLYRFIEDQMRTGAVTVNGSIVDFLQKYRISKDVNVERYRKKWERFSKKSATKTKKVKDKIDEN
jgi:hypothetical protein